MKTKNLIALAYIAIATTLFSSCGISSKDIKEIVNASKSNGEFRDSKEWGKVIEKNIDITSDFTSVIMNGGIDIVLTQSDSTSITVKGNEKAIERHDIYIEDDKFVVDIKNKGKSSNIPSLAITISAPNINNIEINGAGNIDIKNDYKIEDSFCICVNGAGDLNIKRLECENMNITINGAGDVKAKKITCKNKAEFTVNGAGDIDGSINANAISTNIAGAGDADLTVDCNNLYVSVSGTGDIKLKGKCINFRKSESNLGAINSKELQYNKKN